MKSRFLLAVVLLSGVLMAKEIAITVDYYDNVWKVFKAEGNAPDKGIHTTDNIADMMDKFATELKATAVFWIYNFYETNHRWIKSSETGKLLNDRELIKFIVDCAHKRKLKLIFVVKPFETGITAIPQPYCWIKPEAGRETINGIIISNLDEYALANPEYRMKRRPEPAAPFQLPVTSVKLVNEGNMPPAFNRDDIELYISRVNGEFQKYDQEFQFAVSSETRDGKPVKVVTLSPLNIAPEYRYIRLDYIGKKAEKKFFNREDRILELYHNDRILPQTNDNMKYTLSSLLSLLEGCWMVSSPENTRLPVKYLPKNYGKGGNLSYSFGQGPWRIRRYFDHAEHVINGHIAVCRDHRQEFLAMHPAYPEVRNYWLKRIQPLIDAGADGIDVRVSSHSTWTKDGELYGFNQPVVEEYRKLYGVDITSQPYDKEKLRELQGKYYTMFLQELKERTKAAGIPLIGHVSFMMLHDIGRVLNDIPVNFNYEWEKWITSGILDGVTIKYFPWPWDSQKGQGKEDVKKIADLAHKHKIPVYLNVRTDCWYMITSPKIRQSTRMQEKDIARIKSLLGWAWEQPVEFINLYEGNDFTLLNPESQKIELSPELIQMIGDLSPAPEK